MAGKNKYRKNHQIFYPVVLSSSTASRMAFAILAALVLFSTSTLSSSAKYIGFPMVMLMGTLLPSQRTLNPLAPIGISSESPSILIGITVGRLSLIILTTPLLTSPISPDRVLVPSKNINRFPDCRIFLIFLKNSRISVFFKPFLLIGRHLIDLTLSNYTKA